LRILGIDLGERHVGVAVWDDPDLPARPLATLTVTAANVVESIAALAQREGADQLVVGLPLRLDGREGTASRSARRVAKQLAARTRKPVALQDERLTTAEAHAHRKLAGARGREGVDARAAAILLQTYVDTTKKQWPKGAHDE
jgi:putative Holliday junction resolvase